MRKRILGWLLLLAAVLMVSPAAGETGGAPLKVVSLLGSYAEAWTVAGGALVGATEDAVSERGMDLGGDVAVIGTVKAPNLEMILDLEPDLVLYSLDLVEHVQFVEPLEKMGIRCEGYSVTTYGAYMDMMRAFCALTGREDLYQAQEETVRTPIEALIRRAKADPRYGERTALMLRAFSTGVRAQDSSSMAGAMLADMGLRNIADGDGALRENLSLEAIVEADPDYVFLVTMGSDDEKAMASMAALLTDNPAWGGLTAVKEGRYVLMDKDLFHYKPNARWAESYQYLYELLYAS
jgi:iron complex transport system substrate-binding protein